MTKKLLILVILVFVSVPVFAQTVDTAWVRRYNGLGNAEDEARAIAVDGSGNVYVTGNTQISGEDHDYATIKYLPNGDTAWVRRYNREGNYPEGANALTVDNSGNVYVTGGGITGIMETYSDYITIKYLPNVDTAWVRRYNGLGNTWDEAYAIAVDGSGNVYVTGGSGGSDTLWGYATIKYYPSGDTDWVRRYDGPGGPDVHATAIFVDHSGNVYATGTSYNPQTNYDYATIKYLPNGDTAWVRRFNGPGNSYDVAQAIAVDGSGNVYVTGGSEISFLDVDYTTIKYLPNGDTAWVRRYNGPGNTYDRARAIAVDGSGNVYVTGYSVGSRYRVDDYATIKYDPDGNQLWEKRYNGPGNGYDGAYAIAVDGSGNVYVTGYSAQVVWPNPNYDYATIKYVQTPDEVKDETGNREKPSEFTLSQNYPNPFNQSTKIEFTLSQSGFVNLNIYDLLGRKVRTLVSENLSLGYKSVFWDGKDNSGKVVSSWIYFYRLKIGDFSEAKRLVLLK